LKLFDDFRSKFSKKYASDEEKKTKYDNFQNFLKLIDERNEKEKDKPNGAVHGITQFSDLSESEFKKFLGYKAPSSPVTLNSAVVKRYTGSATSVDWTGIYTTAVKDQGYCGSCWAFSATSQIESDAIRAGILTTSDALSPQQIVSCDEVDYGCDGGNTETAYMYVKTNGGLVSSTEYPYTSYWGKTGSCSSTDSATENSMVTLSTFYTLGGEDKMESYMLSTGPLSVCLDASTWSSYTSGIVSAEACGTDVDHCVQAVGINTDEGYWIVRNSWGTSWGIDGHIWLETGTDACAITTDPTYVVPASA
jgi:cathepsin F